MAFFRTRKIIFLASLLLALFCCATSSITGAHASPLPARPVQLSDTAPRCYVVADRLNSDSGADALVALNLATGESKIVGETGTFDIEAIAFAPDAQTLYAANGQTFGTLNLRSGSFVPIGPLGAGSGSAGSVRFDDVDGLTVDATTKTIFGVQRRPNGAADLLIKIDPASGSVLRDGFGNGVDYREISVTAAGEDDVDDIAADPFSGVLYAVANRGGTGGTLLTIARSSGAINEIGSLTVDDIEGIGFFSNGTAATLYGSTGDNGPLRAANSALYLLDKRAGGATPVRDFFRSPTLRDYEALDCLSMPVGLGDYVWNDTNADGVQDETEPPFPNVTIHLWHDDSGNGEPNTRLATTTTNDDGLYEFTELDPTLTYFVEVESPADFYFSPPHEDVPNTADSNLDPVTGFTDSITLNVGQFDATIDAGLTTPPLLRVSKSANVTRAQPTDLIRYTITYANDGAADATGVIIQEIVPPFTQFVADASTDGWTCPNNELTAGSLCTYMIDIVPAASRGEQDITFTVQVDRVVPEEIDYIWNQVVISDDGEHGVAPSAQPVTEVAVEVAHPTATLPTNEPTDLAPRGELFLPLIGRRALPNGQVVLEITVDEKRLDTVCTLLGEIGISISICAAE